jgi:uncharacterized protein with NRDE domain
LSCGSQEFNAMCLIVIAWRAHPDCPCFVAANRDELHARPTEPAHWWADAPLIFAGRDVMAGGTWLGVTRTGRLAALTNYRNPAQRRADAPSRGLLVTSFLESTASVAETLAQLRTVRSDYNGFNLIFSDGQKLGVYESVRGEGRELDSGIFGLSNHLLDTPWPKVANARTRLRDALAGSRREESALELLRDERQAPDAELPQTGLALEGERLVSSAFIRSPDYGTRSSTLVAIDRNRSVSFDEWSWDSTGEETGKVSARFALSPATAA